MIIILVHELNYSYRRNRKSSQKIRAKNTKIITRVQIPAFHIFLHSSDFTKRGYKKKNTGQAPKKYLPVLITKKL